MSDPKGNDKVLQAISEALGNLCRTGNAKTLDESMTGDPVLKDIIQYINKLFGDLSEVHDFIYALAAGKLDVPPPSRGNICASPPKQLQSQLSTLNWSLEQLLKGKIVSKMEAQGILFQNFNKLVDRVVDASTGLAKDNQYAFGDEDGQKINSWRYHQIMLAVNMLDIKVIETDQDGKVVYANAPGMGLLNGMEVLLPENVAGSDSRILKHLAAVGKEEDDFPVIKEITDSDNIIWYRVTPDTFELPTGQRFFLHVVDDITDWKKNERKLERTANVDQMTSAMSRRAGVRLLKTLNDDRSDTMHCLAFVDIDDLKSVNDIYGHNEGDDYIRIVSKVMLTSTRTTEAVVRYGGDEFLIIFRNCNIELANKVMKRMEENLEKLNKGNVKKYKMSFSYGIQQFGGYSSLDVEELLEQADRQMYENKKAKKSHRADG